MSATEPTAADKVFIIGPGRLGASLGRALQRAAPAALVGVAWHSATGRARAEQWLPGVNHTALSELAGLEAANLIVLTVRDDVIAEVAQLLLGRRADQVVLHTSGLETSEVLRSAGLADPVGSFHPLQTFADPVAGPARLATCVAACEGDRRAVEAGFRLARLVGADPIELPASAKTAYHAAAVVASNYLVVITGLAAQLAALGGIDQQRAIAMLAPLQRGALDNLGRLGVADALTGPIARGDVDTVQSHLAAIRDGAPELAAAYVVLGRHAIELARQRGVDASRLRDIEAIFE